MRSSVGLGADDMMLRGGLGVRGGMGGKTGVRPVDTGDGGVGGQGSTRAADAWWTRSWLSCSSSGVERVKVFFLVGSESKPSGVRWVSTRNGGELFR